MKMANIDSVFDFMFTKGVSNCLYYFNNPLPLLVQTVS